MEVPFLDLRTQWKDLLPAIKQDMNGIIDSCAFIGGTSLTAFEIKLAKLHNKKHAIGVSSGTDALSLILKGLKIGPGDEVIIPANSFIASAFAVSHVGATPVFCDVDRETYLIDFKDAATKVTDRTRAVMPVHLYGQSVAGKQALDFAKKHNVFIVEDAAQAIFNNKIGYGIATAFSFYPSKNLGAFGNAGAVITSNSELAKEIRTLVNQGQSQKYIHGCVGGNYRLDALQAVVLNHGLDYIKEWTGRRKSIAKIYDATLPKSMIPKVQEGADHVYHLYELNLKTPGMQNPCIMYMKKRGIDCGLHYPKPIHHQVAYSTANKAYFDPNISNLPVAEDLAVKLVSLPMFPTMSLEEVEYVVKSLKEFLDQT